MTGRSGAHGWRGRTWGLVQLTHPGPSLATTLVTVWSARAAAGRGGGAVARRVLRAALAMALAQASTGCLNDWADAARDAVAQPYKPIPRGRVSRPTALGLGTLSGIAALAAARPLGRPAGRWLRAGLGAGWAYDLGLSGTLWSPAPYMVGLAAVPMVGLRALAPAAPVRRSFVPVVAALALAAHLANGAPDAQADWDLGRRGLPARLGTARAWRASGVGIGATGVVIAVCAPAGRRRRTAAWVLPAAALLARDQRRPRGRRQPGSAPFVGPVAQSVLLAGAWFSGGWRARPWG